MAKRRALSQGVTRQSYLPRDLNVHLLQFLQLHEICGVRRVSKYFLRQCNSALLLVRHVLDRERAGTCVRFKLHILKVASTHCTSLRSIGEFDFGANPSEQTLRLLSQYFSRILQNNKSLSKIDTRIPGETFCNLPSSAHFTLPALRSLFVSVNRKKQGIALARICPNITRLQVNQPRPNIEQIVTNCLKLEELVIGNCPTLTLPPFKLPNLREIQMPDTQLTDSQCALLAPSLGNVLDLAFDVTKITAEGMCLLGRGATSLELLFLGGICDEDILEKVFRDEDAAFPRLRCVWGVNTGVLRDVFQEFRPKCMVVS
eukprot:196983_1